MKKYARYEMDMTSGPILMNMIRFSIPLMFSSILQLLYNAADMVVVGRFAGADSLAAVGATGSITALLVNLFLGLSVGASVTVAQHYGANRYKDVSESVHSTVALSAVGGTVIAVVGILLARPLLEMMGTPKDVLDRAVIYMRIFFAGMPANLVYNFSAAVLRAVGDTRRPLYYLMLSGLINVLLNLLFVICFKMHVVGVALATVISQVISMALVILCLIRTDGSIHLELKKLRLHRDKVMQIIRIGLPAGLQSSMYAISNTLIQSSINTFGSAAIAGNTAAGNIEGFVSTPLNAFAQATMSFTSQSYGARRPERIGKIAGRGLALVSTLGILLGAIVIVLREPLVGIYASETAMIEWGAMRIMIMMPFTFIICCGDVFVCSLRATGNSLFPMLMSVLMICGIRILWIFTAFAANPTCEILYMSYPISWVLATAAHGLTFLFHKNRVVRRMKDEIEKERAAETAA